MTVRGSLWVLGRHNNNGGGCPLFYEGSMLSTCVSALSCAGDVVRAVRWKEVSPSGRRVCGWLRRRIGSSSCTASRPPTYERGAVSGDRAVGEPAASREREHAATRPPRVRPQLGGAHPFCLGGHPRQCRRRRWESEDGGRTPVWVTRTVGPGISTAGRSTACRGRVAEGQGPRRIEKANSNNIKNG